MKLLAGDGTVLSGGEDHQKPSWRKNGVVRDTPLCRIIRIVREIMASKIVRGGIGIVEFKPVLPFAILIPQTRFVVGKNFGDNWSR